MDRFNIPAPRFLLIWALIFCGATANAALKHQLDQLSILATAFVIVSPIVLGVTRVDSIVQSFRYYSWAGFLVLVTLFGIIGGGFSVLKLTSDRFADGSVSTGQFLGLFLLAGITTGLGFIYDELTVDGLSHRPRLSKVKRPYDQAHYEFYRTNAVVLNLVFIVVLTAVFVTFRPLIRIDGFVFYGVVLVGSLFHIFMGVGILVFASMIIEHHDNRAVIYSLRALPVATILVWLLCWFVLNSILGG